MTSIRCLFTCGLIWALHCASPLRAQLYTGLVSPPAIDKWMYPFEFGSGGTRPTAPTFASFDPRFDTRDAELLIGWNTDQAFDIPTNLPPSRYLVRFVRVVVGTAVVGSLPQFTYDPTYDSYRTYLATNDAAYLPDTDPGRPLEMYGAGFRGGFNAVTYLENSPFGPLGGITSSNISIGTRNAFAAQHDTNGVLVDISNHVGQTNPAWTNAPFEATPWAVGRAFGTSPQPGDLVPDGTQFEFQINTADPLIIGYLQRGFSQGRLRFIISSLSPANQITPGGTGGGGQGQYPQWTTKENALYPPAAIELSIGVINDLDATTNGLPDVWERFYFNTAPVGADADPDADGATNLDEFRAGTDPTSASSVFRVRLADAGPRPTLTFGIAPSRSYVVEQSTDLRAWTNAAGRVTYPVTGRAAWVAETDLPGTAFLRVRAVPAD
jgi:hypothetical protein